MEVKSAIFDMDGVITDTAQIHFKAWKQIFDDYLNKNAETEFAKFEPFKMDDYIQYVDGMDRIDGIKFFLYSRHIISDREKLTPKEESIVKHIAETKNKLFLELLHKEGVSVFPGTLSLIKELKKYNIKTAVISSSKNCQDILTRANVINLFDAIVDGKALQICKLKGKPDPAIFLEAAKRIQAKPSETIIIEDALSGIIAGKAGDFGLIIGIDRQRKWCQLFKQQGADIVVNDLSELKLNVVNQKIKFIYSPDNEIEKLKKKLCNKKIILFCDYDGTLTPIVDRPEFAVLSNEVKDVLYQLSLYCSIVIISGRQLADLESLVAINGIYYAGNHGFEIIGPKHFTTKFELGIDHREDINQAYQQLVKKLKHIDNCLIENKEISLSVHYRLVDENLIAYIEQVLDEVAAGYDRLKKSHGKKVFELRPNIDWNKGKALCFITKELGFNTSDYVTIYLGDDLTDEDAFKVLRDNDIGILVSETTRQTHANYQLRNTKEAYYFLKEMLAIAKLASPIETENNWNLTYYDFEPEQEQLREALCTLGNGYFAVRGANEEAKADKFHYPGNYFAGCYNQLQSIIGGKKIYNEDLVNMPNWLPITFKIKSKESNQEEQWFLLNDVELIDYRQELNLYRGILERQLTIKDKQARISKLHFKRFVSMADPHLACQQFFLQAVNWSGEIIIKTGIDASIINSGVTRYNQLNSKHLEVLSTKAHKNGKISVLVRTNQSHIEIAMTEFHQLHYQSLIKIQPDVVHEEPEAIYCHFNQYVEQGECVQLNKFITVATNKDVACSDCLTETTNRMRLIRGESFDSLVRVHTLAWKQLWRRCDIKITSEGNDQLIIRLHIFHLLQTISKNTYDIDAGIPARGLHGEAYRGHIFWDELFIMPFFTLNFPTTAKSLLMYRYRRLNMARLLAKKTGYQGAMFPWQSGSNGDETTQLIHLNPRSNKWMPDFSHYQRHVNAAIVFNIWRYFLFTHDNPFLFDYGAEMILEIARFWSSICTFNHEKNRYEILNVVGPDEYHERYPHSTEPGINNNAYTNIMAVWCIHRAIEILDMLPALRFQELSEQLNITEDEVSLWHDITKKMFVPFHDEVIISQFEGYNELAEFDWDTYLKKYGNIERLDRILKAENDSPDNYKVSKQADVLMLFHLFSLEELTTLFTQLGYTLNQDILTKNIFYYLKRTSHGSTLSKAVFASLYKYIDQSLVINFYQDVLNSDVMDIQGGTTAEGVHLGAMASCININLMCFAGISIKNDMLSIEPKLPARIRQLTFNLQFRGQCLAINIDHESVNISLDEHSKDAIAVLINNNLNWLYPPSAIAKV